MAMHRLALMSALAALACAPAPTALVAGQRSEPALLRFAEQDAVITVPDTVPAGAAFTLVATTIGGGCVRQALAHDVRTEAGVTVVALYNRHTGESACTDDLLHIEHRVPLQAGGPGRMAVQLRGGHRSAATSWRLEPWVVTRTVVVR